MKNIAIFSIVLCFFACEEPISGNISVGFYNVENLFDITDDPMTFDEQFLPSSDRKWTKERYEEKLQNLTKVISELTVNGAPTFLGLCEVENRSVIEDLISEPLLADKRYKTAHIESPDERGIDVGFIYDSEVFTVKGIKAYQPDLSRYEDKTRDILHVEGKLVNGEILHFFVNHWPSRGEGRKESESKRLVAAKTLQHAILMLQDTEPDAKIIVMGDFNDEPSNKSISQTLGVSCEISETKNNQLYNAFCEIENQDYGSYRYHKYWDMLDQIMVSTTLLSDTTGIHFLPQSADIKDEPWMIQTGKYEGFPLRTYGGYKYLGGYSDHFPVSIQFQVN